MRSTEKPEPRRVHSVSWHLLQGRGLRSISPTHLAKLTQRTEAMSVSVESMYRATQAAITTTQVVNAMWANAQASTGGREPPEPELAIQAAPIKPLPMPGGAQP